MMSAATATSAGESTSSMNNLLRHDLAETSRVFKGIKIIEQHEQKYALVCKDEDTYIIMDPDNYPHNTELYHESGFNQCCQVPLSVLLGSAAWLPRARPNDMPFHYAINYMSDKEAVSMYFLDGDYNDECHTHAGIGNDAETAPSVQDEAQWEIKDRLAFDTAGSVDVQLQFPRDWIVQETSTEYRYSWGLDVLHTLVIRLELRQDEYLCDLQRITVKGQRRISQRQQEQHAASTAPGQGTASVDGAPPAKRALVQPQMSTGPGLEVRSDDDARRRERCSAFERALQRRLEKMRGDFVAQEDHHASLHAHIRRVGDWMAASVGHLGIDACTVCCEPFTTNRPSPGICDNHLCHHACMFGNLVLPTAAIPCNTDIDPQSSPATTDTATAEEPEPSLHMIQEMRLSYMALCSAAESGLAQQIMVPRPIVYDRDTQELVVNSDEFDSDFTGAMDKLTALFVSGPDLEAALVSQRGALGGLLHWCLRAMQTSLHQLPIPLLQSQITFRLRDRDAAAARTFHQRCSESWTALSQYRKSQLFAAMPPVLPGDAGPRVFAWHGTPLCNLHSILQRGLLVGTKENALRRSGASLGAGIYVSQCFEFAAGYTFDHSRGRRGGRFGFGRYATFGRRGQRPCYLPSATDAAAATAQSTDWFVMLLCEIDPGEINDGSNNQQWCINSSDAVCVRAIFVFDRMDIPTMENTTAWDAERLAAIKQQLCIDDTNEAV